MIEVFQIEGATRESETRWTVIGRCLEDIQVRDHVYATPSLSSSSAGLSSFSITTITAYRVELDVLYGGMTGALLLEGSEGKILVDAKVLVKE